MKGNYCDVITSAIIQIHTIHTEKKCIYINKPRRIKSLKQCQIWVYQDFFCSFRALLEVPTVKSCNLKEKDETNKAHNNRK